MVRGLGMNFLDRYLMHQCNLNKDFFLHNGEVLYERHLSADESAFARWELNLMEAVAGRIEFHLRNKRIVPMPRALGDVNEGSSFDRMIFSKGFSNRLWEEGAEFARLTYETDSRKRVGKSRVPEGGDIIEGGVHVSEKLGFAFIAEANGTCIVLPLISSLKKYDGKFVKLTYPELFARNRQARDFYLKINEISDITIEEYDNLDENKNNMIDKILSKNSGKDNKNTKKDGKNIFDDIDD